MFVCMYIYIYTHTHNLYLQTFMLDAINRFDSTLTLQKFNQK